MARVLPDFVVEYPELSIVVFALQILIVLGLIAAIGLAGAAGP